MTAAFIQSEPTIVTLGADVVQDAQRFTYQALPSGVVFSMLVTPWPSQTRTPDLIAAFANQEADEWNYKAGLPGVVGISIAQQVDGAGNLQDVAQVTVRSASGRSIGAVTITNADFYPARFADRVAEAVAQLNGIEAASPAAEA